MTVWMLLYFIYLNGHFADGKDASLSREIGLKDSCFKPVSRCQRVEEVLNKSECLDLKLTYDYTEYADGDQYTFDISRWYPIKAIPGCWDYLEKLLCSRQYPECFHSQSQWFSKRTGQEICQLTAKECPYLIASNVNSVNSSQVIDKSDLLVDKTPIFLDCDQYVSHCPADWYKKMMKIVNKFSCQWPMVKTSQQSLWIHGFSGCAYHCKTPYFTEDEYNLTKTLFGSLGLVFFIINFFIMVTFILHQVQLNKYQWHPMLLNLLLIHIYMFFGSLGWMVQLIPKIGQRVICRQDDALQMKGPQVNIGESIWCVSVFAMIYFALLATSLTSVSFFFTIYSVIRQFSRCVDVSDKRSNIFIKNTLLSKRCSFSLKKYDNKSVSVENSQLLDKEKDPQLIEVKFAGCGVNFDYSKARSHSLSSQIFVVLISAALLIISITIGEIKADPISGVCFITSDSLTTRICLSILPLTAILIVKSVIIILVIRHFGLIQTHMKHYLTGQQEIHSKRLRRSGKFYAFILFFLWIFCCFSMYTHGYIFTKEKTWVKALRKQFLCRLRQSLLLTSVAFEKSDKDVLCPLESKPNLNIFILHNFSYFSINIVFIICSVFNKHAFIIWKTFIWNNRQENKTEAKISSNSQLPSGAVYFALNCRSLLDSLWNPGIFAYLIVKEKRKTDENNESLINDGPATLGSTECSSTVFDNYQHSGSIRSCVSMPPINTHSDRRNLPFRNDASKDSIMYPAIDNFVEISHSFIGQNSVRRSNSFAGKPCILPNYRCGNISIPNGSCQSDLCCHKSAVNGESLQYISRRFEPTNNEWLKEMSKSLSHSNHHKSTKRFSDSVDGRQKIGISSRSSLYRRKRFSKYSISPKSIAKTFHYPSSNQSKQKIAPSRQSSSFSAESYNSYNLMTQQYGGKWRDLCRTRMTLYDVMLWARAASQNPMMMHSHCQRHCCGHSIMMESVPHHHHRSVSSIGVPAPAAVGNVPFTASVSQIIAGKKDDDCLHRPMSPVHVVNTDKIMDNQERLSETISIDNNQKGLDAKTSLSDEFSDKFNSEDDVVSFDNSSKHPESNKGSEEFCSDDEIISIVNSELPTDE